MKKNKLLLIIKGFCIGGSMLVPGVSGGSMAIILGIYDHLINAARNIFKKPKESIFTLALFVLGSIAGFMVVANPIKQLLAWNEKLIMYFFIGAIVGSIPMILKKAKTEKAELHAVLYAIYVSFGLFLMWLITQIPENLFTKSDGIIGLLVQAAGGFLSATAFVLPGISISFFLVVLGLYEWVLSAIATMDLLALIPFAIGLLIGIAACIKVLSYLLTRHPRPTYLVILGFIIGSVAEIFPGMPVTLYEWLVGIPIFVAGFFAIMLISKE